MKNNRIQIQDISNSRVQELEQINNQELSKIYGGLYQYPDSYPYEGTCTKSIFGLGCSQV